MATDIYTASCMYTAEYGAMALDSQKSFLDREAAVDEIVTSVRATCQSHGGGEFKEEDEKAVRRSLEERNEYRADYGNGNRFLWTLVHDSLPIQVGAIAPEEER